MRLNVLIYGVTLILLTGIACSGPAQITEPSLAIKAPKVAGDPALLVGTTWFDPETKMEYTFKEGNQIELKSTGGLPPMGSEYTVDKGIISFQIGPMSQTATWDGSDLTMGGKSLSRK